MESPTLRAKLFVGLQYFLPHHFLSRLVQRITRVRAPAVKNALISAFVRHFRPAMEEAAEPDPLRYPTFNAFFTRELRRGARTIDPDPASIACPVDGTISQIGRIDGPRILQAKGRYYTVQDLFGNGSRWAARFERGAFATLYLAPYNYHRIHMPLAGTLRAAWYVPGRLFSVNATTAATLPGLFARNERIVCVFEEGPLAFAMILVGALFVGSIDTIWHEGAAPGRPRRACELPIHGVTRLEKGAEMGRFNMGSTVILIFPPDVCDWASGFGPGSTIRVGMPLGRLCLPGS
ncbi:MAG TPA: archaetidylserine decarboxylase [Steroidobacteraceae bacterium]